MKKGSNFKMTIYGYINYASNLEDLSAQWDALLSFHCNNIFGETPFNRGSHTALGYILHDAQPGI